MGLFFLLTGMGFLQLSLVIPQMNFFNCSVMLAEFMIPVMGRNGDRVNPEFTIGILSLVLVHFGMAYAWPHAVPISKGTIKKTGILLLGSITVFVMVIMSSSVSFPYSGDSNNWAPKRLGVLHTERKHFSDSILQDEESGISIENQDFR